ncbi:MAG TPA: aconitase/3-isopropylmalate dehydratase large subunit family protein [Polyangiaceae bacterium]
MARTLLEKIIERSVVYRDANYAIIDVDLLMGHDGTASLIVDRFLAAEMCVWEREKVFIVFDHFSPPATVERAGIQRKLLDFVCDQELPFALNEGICHQLLLEDPRCAPGKVVIGADSHSTTVGALGAFAFGIGATDFLHILRSGKVWLRVPDVVRVELRGCKQHHILGKDLILHISSILRDCDLTYTVLEFVDRTDDGVTMDSRATMCNMVVDIGAKAGMFVPDGVTAEHCAKYGQAFEPLYPDADALYTRRVEIDVGTVDSMVSLPHDPRNVGRLKDMTSDIPIHQVFVGSCTGGRVEDASAMVEVAERFTPLRRLKKIFIPASNRIFSDISATGVLSRLLSLGVAVPNPSCGPCCNIDKGLLADGENCVSTSSRNFQGRMGSALSSVYLASSYTAAASMHTGRLTDYGDLPNS